MADKNLRKAAVLIRSLDSDTAAIMLAQLAPEEAASIRVAIRDLGQLDAEEQADVLAEFRSTKPATASQSGTRGVELSLSATANSAGVNAAAATATASPSARRFEFLATAQVSVLVRFLAREHAQTIAVVLAHLTPERAAAVLGELPSKLQTEAIERLSTLGETDPESVTVVERELAAWIATRGEDREVIARRRETVVNILAAADSKTRSSILAKLESHNGAFAERISADERLAASSNIVREGAGRRERPTSPIDAGQIARLRHSLSRPYVPAPQPASPVSKPLPKIEFDQLINLDSATLAAVLRSVDANVLALALAGSRDELVDRICAQMPKSSARTFQRELRRLGPTRLSDVETAQRAVANAAARHLANRRLDSSAARH